MANTSMNVYTTQTQIAGKPQPIKKKKVKKGKKTNKKRMK